MIKVSAAIWTVDRLLLVIYLFALFGFLMFPTAASDYTLLNIGADKWMHFALFGGLAILLRWNSSTMRHSISFSIGVASVVAVATEVAQGLVAYRSAELSDILAGALGAIIGAMGMNRIMSSPVPERSIGVLVAALGLMVGSLFVLADVIGVGKSDLFGIRQMVGTALGVFVTVGGVRVYLKGLRSESRAA